MTSPMLPEAARQAKEALIDVSDSDFELSSRGHARLLEKCRAALASLESALAHPASGSETCNGSGLVHPAATPAEEASRPRDEGSARPTVYKADELHWDSDVCLASQVRGALDAASAGAAAPTMEEVEQLARTMWRGEVLPGRVLRFGAAVLGLVDAKGGE